MTSQQKVGKDIQHRNTFRGRWIVAGVALAIAGGGVSASAVATAATQPATAHAAGAGATAPTNACRPPRFTGGAALSSLSGSFPAPPAPSGRITLVGPNGHTTNLRGICTWKVSVPSGTRLPKHQRNYPRPVPRPTAR